MHERVNATSQSLNNFLEELNPLSHKPIEWSNTLKQFVGNSRRIVWVCLTILCGWRLKGYLDFITFCKTMQIGVKKIIELNFSSCRNTLQEPGDKCDPLLEKGPLHFKRFTNVLARLTEFNCHSTASLFLLIQKIVKCSQNVSIHSQAVELIQPLELCNICLSRPYHFKFFKGCLPPISLGPFLNTLSHLTFALAQPAEYCYLSFEWTRPPKFECYCYYAVKRFQTKNIRSK